MTFVNHTEVGECALAMIGRIRDKFQFKSLLFHPIGYLRLEVRHGDCMKATVALTPTVDMLHVSLTVSKAAGTLFGETGHMLDVVRATGKSSVFTADILDQTSAKQVEREIV
jgi:hypothetical protein